MTRAELPERIFTVVDKNTVTVEYTAYLKVSGRKRNELDYRTNRLYY